jgi:hypothetical protein
MNQMISIIGFFLLIFGVWFAILQYVNKKGGAKKKVIIKALVCSTITMLLIYVCTAQIIKMGKSDVTLSIGNLKLENGETYDIIFGIPYLDYPSSVALLFNIKNNDDSEIIRDVTVGLEHNGNSVFVWPDDSVSKSVAGPIERDKVRREHNSIGGISTTSFFFDILRPRFDVLFSEPFIMPSPYLYRLRYMSELSTKVNVILLEPNGKAFACNLTVRFLHANTPDALERKYLNLREYDKYVPSGAVMLLHKMELTEEDGKGFYLPNLLKTVHRNIDIHKDVRNSESKS